MHAFLQIVASNALVFAALAGCVALLGRIWKNPAGLHLLWILVLLKLVTPPLVTVSLTLPISEWPTASEQHAANQDAAHQPSARLLRQETAAADGLHERASDDLATTKEPVATIDASPSRIKHYGMAWPTVLMWTWGVGIALFACGHAYRILRFCRLLRAAEVPSAALLGMAEGIATRLGLARVPEIAMLPVRLSPLVWSIGGKPRVFLPAALFERLDADAQQAILAHELAHVRRKDHWVRLLELAIATLFWWHPVVWWACRQLRELEEQCCDGLVLGTMPHAPKTYAKALVDTLDFLSERPVMAPLMATGADSPVSLKRRIKMLKNAAHATRLTLGGVVLLVAVAAVPMAVAFAAKPPDVPATVDQSADPNSVQKRAQEPEKDSATALAEQSLQEGVKEFNEAASKDSIGRSEPPLTEDEVIAAIRGWDRSRNKVDDKTFAIFQKILDTKILPDGSKLEFCTDWETRTGYHFKVWWIDLSVRTGKDAGYGFRIRDRKISSAPAPSIAIRGHVVDEDGGKPVADADVWLNLLGPGRHVQHAKSDSLGRFTLEVPSAEVQPAWAAGGPPVIDLEQLWAYAADHQVGAATARLTRDASDVVIRLGPATDTSFVVLDPEGQPFAGALVAPYYIHTSIAYMPLPEELMARIGARTDAEGQVKFPAASRETLNKVRITARDLGVQVQRVDKSEPPAVVGRTIRLRPAGRIEGRVIADDPAIARGVRLFFTTRQIRSSAPPWPTEGFARVKTDEQGRFAVPEMAAGNLQIEILVDEKQPLRPKLPNSVRVDADKTTTIEIPMVPTVVVRGSVRVKDTGQPIPGADLHIAYGVSGQSARVFSDAEGRFTARVLPRRFGLQVLNLPKEYIQLGEPWVRRYEVPEDAKEFDLPPLEVVPAKSVAGRVIDGHDQPVADMGISTIEGSRRYGYSKSDDKGQFNLTGVPATIDPASARYQWLPEGGSAWSGCEVVTADPLVLRALPKDPARDRPLTPSPVVK